MSEVPLYGRRGREGGGEKEGAADAAPEGFRGGGDLADIEILGREHLHQRRDDLL